ncbi:MAG: O-antigen ligase family protein [Candidatus Firestonebacteria bacterium]
MKNVTNWLVLLLLFFTPLFSAEVYPFFLNFYYVSIIFIFLLWFFQNVFKKESVLTNTKINIPLFSLLLITFVSNIFSKYSSFNLNNLHLAFYILLFSLIINNFNSLKWKIKFIWTVLLSSALVILFAIHQYYIGFDDILRYIFEHGIIYDKVITAEIVKNVSLKRVFATFLYPNVFAGYIVMIIPISLSLLWILKSGLKKIFVLLLMTGLIFVLYLTKSVGSFLTLFISLFIYFYLIFKDKGKVVLSGIIVFGLTLFIILLSRPDLFNFSDPNNSILSRLNYWKDCINIIKISPLIGSGVNSFQDLTSLPLKYPHNFYIQVFCELGVVGFISLVFLVLVIIKESLLFLSKKDSKENKALFIGFFSSVLSFLVHNLVDLDSNMWQNSLMWFANLGILSSFYVTNFKVSIHSFTSLQSMFSGVLNILKRYVFEIGIVCIMVISVLLAKFHLLNFTVIFIVTGLLFLITIFKKERLIKTPIDYVGTGLILLSFLSLLVSVNTEKTLYEIFKVISCIFLFYVTVNYLRNLKNIMFVIETITFVSFAVSVIGIYQYFFLGDLRAESLFPNPNLLGGFLVINISLVSMSLINSKGLFKNILNCSSLISSIICLVLTQSRGAALSFVFVIILFLISLNILASKKVIKKRFRLSISLIIFIIILLLLIVPNPLMSRMVNIGGDDVAAYARVGIYKSALKMFLDKPFLGYGLGTFADVFPKYTFPIEGNIGRFTRLAEFAHNEYLQVISEMGMAGMLLMFIFIIIILKQSYILIKNTNNESELKLILGSVLAIISILIHATVDFNLHFLPINIIFIMLIAVIFSKPLNQTNACFVKLNKVKRLRMYILLLVLILIIVVIQNSLAEHFYMNYFYNTKKHNLEDAEKSMKTAIFLNPLSGKYYDVLGKHYQNYYKLTKDLKTFNISEAYFKSAVLKNKMNAFYHKHLALLYYDAKLYQETVEEYNKAINLYPNDAILRYELGYVYYLVKSYNLAEKILKDSIILEPNFSRAHLLLSEVYKRTGNVKSSKLEHDKAMDIYNKYKNIANINYEKFLIEIKAK